MAISEFLELEMTQAFGQVEELRSAIEAATSSVAISVDVSEVGPMVTEAVGGAQANVEVTASASGVTDEIEAAVAAADATVEVDVNVPSPEEAGLGALDEGMKEATASAGGLTGASAALGGVQAGLAGNFKAVAAAAGPYGIAAAGAATAVLLVAGAAAEAAQAQRLFDDALGDTAAQVERIDIAGLDTDLSSLAVSLGADDDAMRVAIASLARLGTTSGASRSEIAETAETIEVLAFAVTAANPTLGTADQVLGRLTNSLARGGRSAAGFGLSLTSAEIEARALQMTGKATAEELTQFEKAAAGAQLAVESLGPAIGESISAGQADAATKLRSLKQLFSETIEEVGAPVLEGVTKIAGAVEPVVDLVGKNLVLAFKIVAVPIGLVGAALELLEPVFTAVGAVSGFLSDRIDDLTGALGGLLNILDFIIGPTLNIKDLNEDAAASADQVARGVASAAANTEVFNRVMGDVPGSVKPAAGAIWELAGATEEGLDEASSSLEEWASSADRSVAEFITSMAEAAAASENFGANTARIAALGGDTINRAIAGIADPATRALVAQNIAALDDTAIGAIEAGQERVVAGIETQSQAVLDAQTEGLSRVVKAGVDAAQASRTGWHVIVEQAEQAAGEVGPAINTALIPVDISGAAEGTGLSYGEGFRRGLATAGAQAIAEARNLANQVIAEVRRVGGVESPSKVMAEIGGEFTAGFAQGIALRQGEVEFAAVKIAEAAAAEAAGDRDLARARENEVRFLFEEILTRQEQIAVLDRAIAAEARYSDAWVKHTEERRRLLAEEASERQAAVDESVRKLDQLLREEEQVQRRRVDAAETAATEIARAEQRLAADRERVSEELARTLDAEDRRLRDSVASRREQLEQGLDATERFRPDAGLSIGRLISNVDEQNRGLREFGKGLEQLRARGVSEGAIGALGLEEGPEKLGQIRRILAASQDEIARLNAEFRERGGLIKGQALRDTAGVAAEVAAAKVLAREFAMAEIEAREETFADEKARITAGLSVALVALDEEAARIGRDTGVTLGTNIARGLGSQNEAIRRVAQQVLDLGGLARPLEAAGFTVVVVAPGDSVDEALRARR